MKRVCVAMALAVAMAVQCDAKRYEDGWDIVCEPDVTVDGISYSLVNDEYLLVATPDLVKVALSDHMSAPDPYYIVLKRPAKGYSGDVIVPSEVIVPGFEHALPVKGVDFGAFMCSESLTSVQLPESVTEIGEYAFSDCPMLQRVNLHELQIRSIRAAAFQNCKSLKSCELPATVSALAPGAFYCSGLEKLELPEAVRVIDCDALAGAAIKELICHMPDPDEVSVYVGYNYELDRPGLGVDPDCVLYVPSGSETLYGAHEAWKEFLEILPIGGQTGLDAVANDGIGVVEFDLQGRMVAAPRAGQIVVRAGKVVRY